MRGKGSPYIGRKEMLRKAIENGTYERLGLSERAEQNTFYLGRVPNYGGSRGKGRKPR